MPLYMKDGKIIHHIHIPRCGGKSIVDLLVANGWNRLKLPVPQKFGHLFDYNKPPIDWQPVYTSHEHNKVWAEWLSIPEISPIFQFAVVRNPYEKFNSSLVELSRNEDAIKWVGRINASTIYKPPKIWLDKLLMLLVSGYHHVEHNLFCPQSRFMGDGVCVYKLETGLEKLIEDLVSKDIVKKGSVIPHANKGLINVNIKAPWHEPDYQPQREIFEQIYEEDFINLKYVKRHFIGDSNRD